MQQIEEKYDSNPCVCYYCGKPIRFKKFQQQIDQPKKFCCKKCIKNYQEETKDNVNNKDGFSSQTEKTIYTYLMFKYPNANITHNLKDIFPPYEIDICIDINFPIYIEYNGIFHCSKKQKGLFTRSIRKHQINDKIKKEELCQNRKFKMIRIWSEIGIYSKQDIFNKVLIELAKEIDNINKNSIDNNIGLCTEMVIDLNGDIHPCRETFK